MNTTTTDEIDKCDASRRWIEYAMKLEQQYAMDKKNHRKPSRGYNRAIRSIV